MPNRYIPRLNGLIDARVAAEIVQAIQSLYNYCDEIAEKAKSESANLATSEIRKQLNLFAANLAAPLIEPSKDKLATLAEDSVLEVGDVPNLPASKITSGAFPFARLDGGVLKTGDGLSVDVLGAPNVNTGKVEIQDNAGNVVNVMVCA